MTRSRCERLAHPLPSRVLTSSALLILAPALLLAYPRLHVVSYDHSTGNLSCSPARPPAEAGVCVLPLREGDFIALRVVNSIPGLFSLEVTRTNKALVAVPKSVAGAIGLPSGFAASGAAPAPENLNLAISTLAEGFNAYTQAFAAIQKRLNSASFADYNELREDLETARNLLVAAVGSSPFEPDSIAKAIKKADESVSESSIATRLREIEAFRNSTSESLAALPPHDEQIIDRAFALVCTVKTTDSRFLGGQRVFLIEAVEEGAWAITTTGGFAFSGLTDENYAKKTVIDTPASGGNPAVTRNQAVSEGRDPILPEAALFVNVFPFAHKAGWLAFSLGAGVTTGASGRLYLGVSWRLGRVAQLTLGAAGGKVKRLSKSVDKDDLGPIDPQATRVDRYDASFFAGISFRIGS